MTAWKKLLTLAPLLLLLANCAPTTGTNASSPPHVEAPPEAADPTAVCVVWTAISWADEDTDQTISEVKANNRARVGWGCPQ